MTRENKDLIRRFYAELDRHNFAIYDTLCTADFRSHFPGREHPQTRSERAAISAEFYAALPDLVHTIDDIIGEEDRVAFRARARGTHTSAFRGIPPTGRMVEFSLMRYYRMSGGLIAEEWAEADRLGLLQQMGAVVLRREGGS